MLVAYLEACDVSFPRRRESSILVHGELVEPFTIVLMNPSTGSR